MANLQKQAWSGGESRKIVKRVVVEGTLVLETPAHFGSGDEQGSVMPLIFDEVSQKPLLTGASIAGALRSYFASLEKGYRQKQVTGDLVVKLFGGIKQDDGGNQSSLIIDDAIGENAKVELRDGVKIDAASRTATDGALYSFMVWTEGTTFNLRFELLICETDDKTGNETELKQGLATALYGLQNGEITLGARKHRGFGRVTVKDWRVREFDLTKKQGLIDWVIKGGNDLTDADSRTGKDIFNLFNTSQAFDKRKRFTLEAKFDLESSILIRADSTVADMSHLRSNGKPIVSGTSLAGVIHARATKVANTLNIKDGARKIDDLFGEHGTNTGNKENRTASRIIVEEREITGGEAERWVQSRVAIDRFTGGALETALFNQQPQFGGEVCIKFEIRNPEASEIGLLLLVLKDLWTADLPLGGESSVGRGRLRGQIANINYDDKKWTITQAGSKLEITGDARELEKFVAALTQLEKEANVA